MPEPLTSYIFDLESKCLSIYGRMTYFRDEIQDLAGSLFTEGLPLSSMQASQMASDMSSWCAYWYSTTVGVDSELMTCLYWIDNNWHLAGGDVDMDAILSAMVSADPNHVTYFIGLVDAYRTALWNQPFNADYYAALVQGFMDKWP